MSKRTYSPAIKQEEPTLNLTDARKRLHSEISFNKLTDQRWMFFQLELVLDMYAELAANYTQLEEDYMELEKDLRAAQESLGYLRNKADKLEAFRKGVSSLLYNTSYTDEDEQ